MSPASVALVGASDRDGSLGRMVYENLVEGGYAGELYLVNPRHSELFGRRCYSSLDAIGKAVDLAVIATPATAVADILEQGGRAGLKTAVVLTAGFAEIGAAGKQLVAQVMAVARTYGIRLLGPNCIGLARPAIGLNATFARGRIAGGNIALVSQSGAVCSTILDWAQDAGVGFSSVVSLGGSADLDFGEILDYLIHDDKTAYVLLYIEGIRDARGFLSALRAAARTKPVIVLKVGRFSSGAQAASSHTGALVGNDEVFAAALRRAGTLRVRTSSQLFAAARMFAFGRPTQGGRLAIVTNGGGPGVMAADEAAEQGVSLATLSESTMTRLDATLPAHWSHANPVDVIGDASAERMAAALAAVLDDPAVDAALTLFCPQRATTAADAANAVIAVGQASRKPLLTAWLGGTQAAQCNDLFEQAGLPNFDTPESAVEAFSFLAAFQRNQAQLLETASPLSPLLPVPAPDLAAALALRDRAVAEGRTLLSEFETKQLLAVFRIPVPGQFIATSEAEALRAAESLGYPVVLKIHSPDISHKSDVGGVRLDLKNAGMVASAYRDMLTRVKELKPDARIEGVVVQPMLRYADSREVLVGITTDPVFGPVVVFGAGGVAVEALHDTALALPPLNDRLAGDLIPETRVARLLGAYRNFAAVDEAALRQLLVQVSSIACLLPWVREMDLNPVLSHPNGVMVADARIVVDAAADRVQQRYRHMAIYPYPQELQQEIVLADGARLTVRAIMPEDAQLEREFVDSMSAQSRYMRFMHHQNALSDAMLARFTQIDYDRDMALIALAGDGERQGIVAVARYFPDPDRFNAEFAVAVGDAWQGRGVGHQLMLRLIDCATAAGYRELSGSILTANGNMLDMVRNLGFAVHAIPGDGGTMLAVKALAALPASPASA